MRGRDYKYRPVLDRTPGKQTIAERAEFLAHEIHEDRLAPEGEIADAIEAEIRRFAPSGVDRPGGYFRVNGCERGPLKKHANGTTAHEWARLRLSCGHVIPYERLKNPRRRPPTTALCKEVHR